MTSLLCGGPLDRRSALGARLLLNGAVVAMLAGFRGGPVRWSARVDHESSGRLAVYEVGLPVE